MKISIITVGKKHDQELKEAIDDFTNRISHFIPIDWKYISNNESIKKESDDTLSMLDEKDHVVLFDEKGKEFSSVEMSSFLEKTQNASIKQLIFIIGGAFGVDGRVKERANTVISLSRLTFPHQLVRLIVVEQIYRAFTILKGGKYHHE